MINTKYQNMIKKVVKKKPTSLSGLFRELPITKDQIRISVSFLLGAEEIEETIYGRTKVYNLSGGSQWTQNKIQDSESH